MPDTPPLITLEQEFEILKGRVRVIERPSPRSGMTSTTCAKPLSPEPPASAVAKQERAPECRMSLAEIANILRIATLVLVLYGFAHGLGWVSW